MGIKEDIRNYLTLVVVSTAVLVFVLLIIAVCTGQLIIGG